MDRTLLSTALIRRRHAAGKDGRDALAKPLLQLGVVLDKISDVFLSARCESCKRSAPVGALMGLHADPMNAKLPVESTVRSVVMRLASSSAYDNVHKNANTPEKKTIN